MQFYRAMCVMHAGRDTITYFGKLANSGLLTLFAGNMLIVLVYSYSFRP